MPSPKLNLPATLLLALTLIALSACSSMPSAEQPPIARKHKLMPLPAAISQINLKPSTDTLSKGQEWLQSTEKLLPGATQK